MLRNPAFWVVLFLVIVLLFGANKLPALAGSVGKSLKIFKKEVNELQEDGEAKSEQDSGTATISYDQPTASTHQPPQATRHTGSPAEPPK
ncbi:twin-arginine translocase TatA/TatE family subunit [Pseudactinotalea sp. Z1732]|uniref:twin-arginine translocase TatA/TatE family subunit n=1 Tax=Micrococcales TaxID=85006 RepID=UPI003C7EB846